MSGGLRTVRASLGPLRVRVHASESDRPVRQVWSATGLAAWFLVLSSLEQSFSLPVVLALLTPGHLAAATHLLLLTEPLARESTCWSSGPLAQVFCLRHRHHTHPVAQTLIRGHISCTMDTLSVVLSRFINSFHTHIHAACIPASVGNLHSVCTTRCESSHSRHPVFLYFSPFLLHPIRKWLISTHASPAKSLLACFFPVQAYIPLGKWLAFQRMEKRYTWCGRLIWNAPKWSLC